MDFSYESKSKAGDICEHMLKRPLRSLALHWLCVLLMFLCARTALADSGDFPPYKEYIADGFMTYHASQRDAALESMGYACRPGKGQFGQYNCTLGTYQADARRVVYEYTYYKLQFQYSTYSWVLYGPVTAYLALTKLYSCEPGYVLHIQASGTGASPYPNRLDVPSGYQSFCRAISAPSPKSLGICTGCHGNPSVGNPINSATSNKYQVEIDYAGTRSLSLNFHRTYNSGGFLNDGSNLANDNWKASPEQSMVGRHWRSTHDRLIKSFISYTDTAGIPAALVYREDGKVHLFKLTNGKYVSDTDVIDQLSPLMDTSGIQTGWKYVNADDETELYDVNGKLLSIISRAGYARNMTYSDGVTPTDIAQWPGLLIRVTDSLGHQLNFAYDSTGRIVKMTGPAGEAYQYAYNSGGYLSTVTYPDGKTRTYVYNEPAHTQNASLPHALTGIVDENGKRFSTFKYHSSGRAISTEHAGGVGRVIVGYGSNNSSTITDALGTVYIRTFQNILGTLRGSGQNQPAGAGSGVVSSSISYDANGNIASRTDFNGVQTAYSYDLARNLEARRVEAAGTPEARTISTEWHPSYRLPTKIAEPKRLTVNSYDDKGNLLSKTMQATSDETGAQGFAAEVVGAPRIWRYTYNPYGQVLTATGPRTDVDDTTRYAYDEQGNLTSITNAAGQVTILSNYDAHGRVGRIVDPNGLVTELTYAPRGWLTAKTVGGEVTNYEYDGVGQLKKVTQPDDSYVAYTYDDAHRLTAIADSLGNRIAYTLDAMGNRIREEVHDPDGALSRQTTRVYDALNRLQQITGGRQ